MPDFLIVGAQKSGTSSLYYYLAQHPQVVTVPHKEIQFFSVHYAQGWDWYRSQLGLNSPDRTDEPADKLYGEATPYYLFHPLVPQRVYQHIPQVKLIILLRNPVDRAISHYHHEVKLGFERATLEEAIALEPDRLRGEIAKMTADPTYHSHNLQHYSYRSRGLYLEQLQRWMAYFPREQVLVLNSEEFYQQPSKILARVLDFLHLPPLELTNYPSYNAGNYSRVSTSIEQTLLNDFDRPNRELARYLQHTFGSWDCNWDSLRDQSDR
jgi:Sulfotransferase domain